MIYAFWFNIFQLSLKLEKLAITLRDISQQRKMEMVKPVPEFWESFGGW